MASNRFDEVFIFRWVVVFALFLLLSFNRDLAIIYIAMLFGDWLFWKSDKQPTFVMERSVDRAKTLAYAFGAYIVFFAINALLNSFSGTGGGLSSVFTNLASTTPILQGSNVLTFLGWGLLIPIVETRFFFLRLFEAILELVNESPAKFALTKKTVFAAVMTSGLFALFHITSKNLENVPLMLTFLFGLISCYLVIKERQGFAATLLHVLTNSTAVLYTFRPEVFSFLPLKAAGG